MLADVRLQQAFAAVAGELARRDGEIERRLGQRNEHFGRVCAACLGLEEAGWMHLIETERMLAVGIRGTEVAVFARLSVEANALVIRKRE